MSTMAVTLLTMPEDCRNQILNLCLLQQAWVVVDSSKFDTPGLLRTCKQLRKEGPTIFYRKNTFLLILDNLAPPQGHWIHKVADVSNKPVITRIREQEGLLGSPQKWLSAFYNERTRVQWAPSRPGSNSRSKHPLVNVLRCGFLIASLLKAQRREKEGKDTEEDKRRQRSAELVLETWCETAKRAGTLGHHLRGRKSKEFYWTAMETFKNYHYNPRNDLSPEGARTQIIFGEAFSIVDIMQDDDWQVVQQVLRHWIQTVCRESAERLCAGNGRALVIGRNGPRRRDLYHMRARRK